MSFDAIVIGSGFGGAITACRLQENGYKVLVLERGRRWDKNNFPRKPTDPWMWDSDDPEHRNGWLELRRFPNMAVAAAAGVGGGSLVYANISCEAHPWRFDSGWPKEVTYQELKPHYDAVKSFMNVRPVPDNQWPPKMKLVKEAAEKAGFGNRFRKLELAVTFDDDWTYEKDHTRGAAASLPVVNTQGCPQGTCTHLGDCDIGCEVHAKNTLDRNYLFWAEKKGAEVRPLHFVTNIEPLQPSGFRVHFDDLTGGVRRAGNEISRLVLVAAGSMGSTELMLRCKHVTRTLPNLSAFLGQHWSSNGDFLTPAAYPARGVEPTWGPTITAAIDFFQPGSDEGFWIQDGGIPNLAADLIEQGANDPDRGFKAKMLLQYIQTMLRDNEPFQEIMPWFAQGIDAANGVFSLKPRSKFDPRPRLHLEWDVRKSQRIIDRIVEMHKILSEVTGGHALVPPTWSLFKDLVTPHPLGGCNMGTTVAEGVVNHKGEVFGYPGLYVTDGAIVPEALGVNPSRTIGALAERNAAILVSESK